MSYARATAIAMAALDLPLHERGALVQRECGTDDALRADVESLIAAHDRAGAFLETPPDTTDVVDAALAPGDIIGTYRIERVLGEGGMGIVYLAHDARLGRDVALKSIAPHFADTDVWRARLRREARAAAALTHPGVATVYALEEIDGRLFLATEYVQGETLRDRLSRGPLTEPVVRDIARQLASALAAAHARGIVHRDIKPENVMSTATGIKILDFGLAHLDASEAETLTPHLTQDGAVFGTPAYMSPEQLRGEPAGPASDIFSVGVVLAELATGRHPFTAANPAALVARALSAEPDLQGCAPALAQIIGRCLAKTAADRFASATELSSALDASTAHHAVQTIRGSDDARWWWQCHQAGASVFAIALAVYIWLMRDWLSPPLGRTIVIATIICALGATSMRLHLWFTLRVHPRDAASQRRRVIVWTRAGDVAQAVAVAGAALLLPASRASDTAVMIAAAVVLVVVSVVIEPSTTRAARLS